MINNFSISGHCKAWNSTKFSDKDVQDIECTQTTLLEYTKVRLMQFHIFKGV